MNWKAVVIHLHNTADRRAENASGRSAIMISENERKRDELLSRLEYDLALALQAGLAAAESSDEKETPQV